MLELGLASMVARLGHSLVLWLPVILSGTLGVQATLSFFHWLWRGGRSIFGKNDNSVEVYQMYSDETYEDFARRNRAFEEELDADRYAEKHGIVEKVSSKGNPYREYNGNKYFASGRGMFVITKEGGSYWTDAGSYYGDDELIPSERKRWYKSIVSEYERDNYDDEE